MLYVSNSELASETFDKIWFDSNNPNIMYATVDEKGTMKIDCLTGKHTPFCSDIRYNLIDGKYCVDTQGNILKLNEDCITTETDLVRVEEKSDSAHMVCKNKKGNYVVLDITTLKPIIDKEFDSKDISCTHINQDIRNNPTLRIVSDKRDHYLVDKENKIIKAIRGDSVAKLGTGNHPKKIV